VLLQDPNDLLDAVLSSTHGASFGGRRLILRGPVSGELVTATPPAKPESTSRRYFGMNTTWYLHSHSVWFNVLVSVTIETPSQ
jgi:hypothetical protein